LADVALFICGPARRVSPAPDPLRWYHVKQAGRVDKYTRNQQQQGALQGTSAT